MTNKEDRFPKRFLKCADLKVRSVRLVSAKEYVEALKDSSGKETEKSILAFQGTDRELILNVTNWDAVVEITREGDSAKWAGHEIELLPTTTMMGGKKVDCIRVRAPDRRGPAKPSTEPNPVNKSGGDQRPETPWTATKSRSDTLQGPRASITAALIHLRIHDESFTTDVAPRSRSRCGEREAK
jgi:hypothetical protein